MNKQERLMDYLYGEMSAAERTAFERELSQDPDLEAELASLQQTRQLLQELPDVSPAARVLTIFSSSQSWRKWGIRAGAAAAVLLLLFVFDARIDWSGQGLVFTLGQTMDRQEAPNDATSSDAVVAALEKRLEQQENELDSRLLTLDSLWQERLASRESAMIREWQNRQAAFQAAQHRSRAEWEQRIQPELAGLIQSLQLEQQRELRLLLTGLYDEWQQTRSTDLETIEKALVKLYRNDEYQQQEMEALLDELARVGD